MITRINNFGDVLMDFSEWDKLNQYFLSRGTDIWVYFESSRFSKPINKQTRVQVKKQEALNILDNLGIKYTLI